MAVISTDEQKAGRSGKRTGDWTRTYTRTWRVITDDPQTGPIEAAGGIGVGIGDYYKTASEDDIGSFCNEIDATVEGEDGQSWIITVTYGPYNPNTNPKDPTERPIQVNWGTAQFQRVADQTTDQNTDGSPKAVVNSAGDRFDPPIMKDDSRPVLVIVRNEPTFNQDLAALYRDSINIDPFWGHDPYTVKCLSIEAQLTHNPDIGYYWPVTYKFEFNDDGWISQILDAGFRELNAGGTDAQAILDYKGLPVANPALLDGHGKKLAEGSDAVFLEFNIYKEMSFEGLNLSKDMIPGNNGG